MVHATNNLPPWQSVAGYFRPWKKSGLWLQIVKSQVRKLEKPEKA